MASGQSYCVRYEGNNSKRWDGKEIWIEATVLEELYEPYQLTSGSHVSIPWKGKGGRISYWNAIIVNPHATEQRGRHFKKLHCFYKYIHACN